jgi:myb proto-oncogene protein
VGKWAEIARHCQGRTDQQCMGRWRRHLDPAIKRDSWTPEEDAKLTQLHLQYGTSWSRISRLLKGRTSQQCRARWHQLHGGRAGRSGGGGSGGNGAVGGSGGEGGPMVRGGGRDPGGRVCTRPAAAGRHNSSGLPGQWASGLCLSFSRHAAVNHMGVCPASPFLPATHHPVCS